MMLAGMLIVSMGSGLQVVQSLVVLVSGKLRDDTAENIRQLLATTF
jgi:hypothetical protein